MEQKFFFFDIDNTLVPWPSGVIPESSMYALRELERAGHRVAIATGRIQCDAISFAEQAGIRDFVGDGGYSITINGDLHSMESLDLDECRRFLKQLDTFQIPWAITTENKTERLTHWPNIKTNQAPWDHFKTIYVPHLDYDLVKQVYKIYIYLHPEEEKLHAIDYGALETIRYGKESILIEPMDKARGIKILADHYGIPYENVVTFGDGNNDLRMFDPQWTNIAMGNARSALKKKADYVTTACTEDGIYNACRHFGWIK